MIYSAMDIGGFAINVYLTNKFDTYKLVQVLVCINMAFVGLKLTNFFTLENRLIHLVTTFTSVLLTSSTYGICSLNHMKMIRPDLAFISFDNAIAIAAFAC